MSKKDEEAYLPVKVDIGAKASFEAKVSTEIPSASSGRLLDALTDIIRPFSEGRGLRADQLRLQREEVLIKVARLARQRIDVENRVIEPIPTKTLIPLLEKASLENVDDDYMIERWANLMASATNKQKVNPKFVGILSDLTTEQAKLLEEIFFKPALEDKSLDGIICDLDEHHLKGFFDEKLSTQINPMQSLLDSLKYLLSTRGYELEQISMSSKGRRPIYPDKTYYIKMDHATDLQILLSLNLLEKKRFTHTLSKYDYSVSYYQITALGLALLRLCIPQVNSIFEEIELERETKRKEREKKHSIPS